MHLFIPSRIADNLTVTLVLVALLFATRLVAEAVFTRRADPATMRRRKFTIRAIGNVILAVGLLAIWLSEIQDMMLSLTAVLVAFVVATKELIMCAAGSMLRFGGHLFKVGDRIELGGIHGEVIDHGLFSTTIAELPSHALGASGTGRTVMLPNSVLLTGVVRVEAQPRHYAPHRFILTLEHPQAPGRVIAALETAAENALGADRELAARFHQYAARKAGFDTAGPTTEVSVTTSDLGKLQFHVMIYCLVKDARGIEQTILRTVLDELAIGAVAREGRPAGAEAMLSELARQLRDGQHKGRGTAARAA
ncbi:mechanosensitive ion channel family protein [Jiella sp. MQZ9-1]|uniref:Mechanosensitive ion channel family protein n=1 Tax=Jiella flava TaxID=2816857 RepID=A0A939FTE8_9HYPH|nr:mechanosensitive ion channel family protein [Jiella flava]MBO0661227.1 mechanosensitive ion channel family protein [Jiella flava]MCD2469872.1 mechanosensitive ion channel family protein [Jiella flava]